MRTLEGGTNLAYQRIDLIFSIAQVTAYRGSQSVSSRRENSGRKTFDEMTELPSSEASGWVRELEGPQEVGGLLEVRSNGKDLVDQILHADNAVLAQVGLDDRVVSESNALLVDLSVSTLVDEFTNRLQVGISVGNPWLNNLQHLEGGLGHANKDTIIDLKKTEELKDLSGLWCNLVDTTIL
jgi:hypothetical protein